MFTTINAEADAMRISAVWNQLVEKQSFMPDGIGPTSNFELSMLAWRIHVPSAQLRLFVDVEHEAVRAILPCYAIKKSAGPMRWTEMGLLPELYPGRTGIIYDQSKPDGAQELIRRVLKRTDQWDVLSMTFIADTAAERAFVEAVADHALTTAIRSEIVCPYIEISDDWNEFLDNLGNRFRRNLRSRERQLRSLGNVAIRDYTRPDECDEFLDAVFQIERESWKETAGTSLTRNPAQRAYHEQMTHICAQDGSLQGFILTVDDAPIAHIIGLRSGDVYLNLKSSFSEKYRKYGLGTIIKSLVMRDVFAGNVRYWDFVGEAQDHKMQWTDKSYTLRKYAVFSSSVRGQVARYRYRIATHLRRTQPLASG